MGRLTVQIGIINGKKISQSIKAYLNDVKLSWDDGNGTFLSSMKDRHYRGMIWYMAEVETQKEDTLRLSVKTFIKGVGPDEVNTFESLYYVDEEAPVREYSVTGVGMKGYPLIKGRFLEIESVTEDDKRKADIEEFMNEGF